MTLTAHDLWFAYEPRSNVLRGVDAVVAAGDLLVLLGSNGAGKSTLLHCLAGLLRPQRGRVRLDGQDIDEHTLKERAQRLALVPQAHVPVFSYSTWEVVLMGRAPHLKGWGGPGRRDRAAATEALQAVDLAHLARRPYTTLSGGEQRLALIARGLAQGAQTLLMDEPDAHLDPAHQHEILHLATLLADRGLSLGITSHNPNNALVYASTVGLLADGVMTSGPPQDVLTPQSLEGAYGVPFHALTGQSGQRAFIAGPSGPR